MYYPAELILKNYIPDLIESGMFFIAKSHLGENVNPPQLYHLKEEDYPLLQFQDTEALFYKEGYPVELYVIDPIDHSILATPSQIGWFDAGEDSDEYRDIELKDINAILTNEGLIEIEIDETANFYGAINVILEEEKVVIRML